MNVWPHAESLILIAQLRPCTSLEGAEAEQAEVDASSPAQSGVLLLRASKQHQRAPKLSARSLVAR